MYDTSGQTQTQNEVQQILRTRSSLTDPQQMLVNALAGGMVGYGEDQYERVRSGALRAPGGPPGLPSNYRIERLPDGTLQANMVSGTSEGEGYVDYLNEQLQTAQRFGGRLGELLTPEQARNLPTPELTEQAQLTQDIREGQGSLSRSLRGEPAVDLSPEAIAELFQVGVSDPMIRQFEEDVRPRIEESFAQSGALFSTGRGNAVARAFESIEEDLISQLARTQLDALGLEAQLAQQSASNWMNAALGLPSQSHMLAWHEGVETPSFSPSSTNLYRQINSILGRRGGPSFGRGVPIVPARRPEDGPTDQQVEDDLFS